MGREGMMDQSQINDATLVLQTLAMKAESYPREVLVNTPGWDAAKRLAKAVMKEAGMDEPEDKA